MQVPRAAHNGEAAKGRAGPPVTVFGTELPLDASKTVRSIALPPDSRLEVHALTLAS